MMLDWIENYREIFYLDRAPSILVVDDNGALPEKSAD